MRRIARQLAFACLVGAFVVTWSARGGEDEVVAQKGGPTLTQMYTGPDGLSHFREIPWPKPGERIKVSSITYRDNRGVSPSPYALSFHTAPSYKQYLITLGGKAEIVGSGGQTVIADRDHVVLATDTTGKGHITKGIDWVTLFIQVEEPPAQPPRSN